jgi:modulator of FtsH protease
VRATIVGLAVAEHVPFLVGAVLLLFGQQAGLWGLVVGVVMVVIASMVNAWVLLIEVRR